MPENNAAPAALFFWGTVSCVFFPKPRKALVRALDSIPLWKPELAGGSTMKTFLATTLTDTAVSQDKRRFQLTFVDADGQQYAISIPAAIAADLVPVLESVAATQPPPPGGELTRVPKTCAVGQATGDRMILLRFDDEAPYAIDLEVAQALAEQLQEQSEELYEAPRPALH